MTLDERWRRAQDTLDALAETVDLREPLAALAWLVSSTRSAERADALVRHVAAREPGHVRTESRYRWELSHRVGAPAPDYAPTSTWKPWRASDTKVFSNDPFQFEAQLVAPLAVVGFLELFAERAADPRAAALFDEAIPILRRDLAHGVLTDDPFADTFLLRTVATRPRLLDHLAPVAFAITSAYAAGPAAPIVGIRFPYLGKPLTSATALLADALLAQGAYLPLLADQLAWLAGAQRDDGGFGDADEPSDVLTTTLAASTLARLVPDFDFERVLRFLAPLQDERGLFRALGPDAPWLTSEVLRLAACADEPFASRFRWPVVQTAHRDRKTELPSYGYFLELAELLRAVGTLADAPVELAFIDLIGFRAFNNRHGQDLGDAVLARFGEAISTLPTSRAIRDGGDEFLIVGAPTRGLLDRDLEAFLDRWPRAFRDAFGDTAAPVAPRVLVTSGRAGDLRAMREQLGRAITDTKTMTTDPERGFVLRA